MPPASALAGVPLIGQMGTSGTGLGPLTPPVGINTVATAVPLPGQQAEVPLFSPVAGQSYTAASSSVTYVGEGIAPVPKKVADKILRWDFVEMGELLPEFWLSTSSEQASTTLNRRSRKVTDISTWTMCYATFVGVLGPKNPTVIPELMEYLRTITHASQDFEGLAWERYDAAYRRQAAASGNRTWSRVDTSLYTLCFSACKANKGERCELCLAATHTTQQCALQGNRDPELGSRVKAVESVLVAMAQRPGQGMMPQTNSAERTCRLWNRGTCTFSRCRFRHACSSCGGDHRLVNCPRQASYGGGQAPSLGSRPAPNRKY